MTKATSGIKQLGFAYSFRGESATSMAGAWQQAGRQGTGAVSESTHLIQKKVVQETGLGMGFIPRRHNSSDKATLTNSSLNISTN